MSDLVKAAPEALELLTTRESAAYKLSVSRKEPFLSPILADQLYGLFEAGRTCEEIQALNKGISLGTIVRARIDFNWDQKRQEHFQGLFDRARTQAQQLTLESLSFLGDLLTAYHRSDKEKFQRFIQTADPDELKGTLALTGSGFKLYQAVLELIMKITGQDATKTQNVNVHHTVETGAPKVDRPLTPEEASALLLAPPKAKP